MKLYHGTTSAILARIKQEGILPRAKAKGKQNWKHTVPSNKDAVYLTTAYPWHFAAAATNNEPGLILEIDQNRLLPWLLCPDEDFMEQGSRGVDRDAAHPEFAPTEWSMKKRTMHYRRIAKFNAPLADESLKHMGTCAYYGAIPFSAVTRYVLIDWEKLPFEMRLRAVDSMVSIMNYRILQKRHEAFCRWFFGDPVTAPELTGNDMWQASPALDPVLKHYEKQNAAFSKIMVKRDGLTVISTTQEKAAPKQLTPFGSMLLVESAQ